MKPLPTLAAVVASAAASLAVAAPASAHCGCAPRHHIRVLGHHRVVRRAERVVYVPVPGPERIVREPVYVPGPERIVREPVYLPGPTRVVREPAYEPSIVRERGWRAGPAYPLPVRYGWDRGYRERDTWRERARFGGEDHFNDRERGWR